MPRWQRFLDCTEQATTLGPHRWSSVSHTCSYRLRYMAQIQNKSKNSSMRYTTIMRDMHVLTPGWHDAERTWFSVIFIVFLYCCYKLMLMLLFFGTWFFFANLVSGRLHLYIFRKSCSQTKVTSYNPISKVRDYNEREDRLSANSGVFPLLFFWISRPFECWFISKGLVHNKLLPRTPLENLETITKEGSTSSEKRDLVRNLDLNSSYKQPYLMS